MNAQLEEKVDLIVFFFSLDYCLTPCMDAMLIDKLGQGGGPWK